MSAVNQLSDYTVRPATEDHESALRAWLPQAFLGRPRPAFLIATPRNDPGTPVAGASLRLLTLTRCGVAPEMQKRLRAALPKCLITF